MITSVTSVYTYGTSLHVIVTIRTGGEWEEKISCTWRVYMQWYMTAFTIFPYPGQIELTANLKIILQTYKGQCPSISENVSCLTARWYPSTACSHTLDTIHMRFCVPTIPQEMILTKTVQCTAKKRIAVNIPCLWRKCEQLPLESKVDSSSTYMYGWYLLPNVAECWMWLVLEAPALYRNGLLPLSNVQSISLHFSPHLLV